jgi:hypothetical protein
MEESFRHSIIFIEGQKKKNREIDELKGDMMNMRQSYDLEMQAMFMELNRVKEDIVHIKSKTGIASNTGIMNNDLSSPGGPSKMLGGNIAQSILTIKRDERRYGEIKGNSSAGSSFGGYADAIPSNIYRGLE